MATFDAPRRVSWEKESHFSAAKFVRKVLSAAGILMMLQQLRTMGEARIAIVDRLLIEKDRSQFFLFYCSLETESTFCFELKKFQP